MPEIHVTIHDSVQRCTDHIMSRVGDDTVLLSLRTNDYFGINAVGTRIWELLESPQSVEKLCSRLAAEFSVAPEACQADVLEFLNQMAEDGLIETEAKTEEPTADS